MNDTQHKPGTQLELRESGNALLLEETPEWRFHLWIDPTSLEPVDDVVYKNPRIHDPAARTIKLSRTHGSGMLLAAAMLSQVHALYPAAKAQLEQQLASKQSERDAESAKALARNAGPELLEALIAMEHEFGRTYLPGSSPSVDAARAAIAKARGNAR